MEKVINVAQRNKLKENAEEAIRNMKWEVLTYILRHYQKKSREFEKEYYSKRQYLKYKDVTNPPKSQVKQI